MLLAEPTKLGAGFALYGDYLDLRSLHDSIHAIVKDSHASDGLGEFVLGLAYDVRHAYQRMRDERVFGFDEPDRVTYQGVKIPWPVGLFQIAVLRSFAAYAPTGKADQANLFRLEYCAEKSLTDFDSDTGAECVEWLSTFGFVSPKYLTSFVSEATYRYLFIGKQVKRRFRALPAILRSFSELSNEYRTFRAHIGKKAAEKSCDPQELQDWDEWPDIKW